MRSASSDSLRRECLDHIVVLNEASLRRILKAYFEYYKHSRTHLALENDAPASRAIQPPALGTVVELPQVGGLHHRRELPEGSSFQTYYPLLQLKKHKIPSVMTAMTTIV